MKIEVPAAIYEYCGRTFDNLEDLFECLESEMVSIHGRFKGHINASLTRSVFRHKRGANDNGQEVIIYLRMFSDNNNVLHFGRFISYPIKFSVSEGPIIDI